MAMRYNDWNSGVRAYRKKCKEIHEQKLSKVRNVLNIAGQKDLFEDHNEAFREFKTRNQAY